MLEAGAEARKGWNRKASVVVAALALTALARVSPVRAQFVGKPPPIDLPILSESSAPGAPPPLAVQALDATHFVVVTREPRLVTRTSAEGPWQQMLVTVVTHYSVAGGKLIPVEHIRVPHGYRAHGQ